MNQEVSFPTLDSTSLGAAYAKFSEIPAKARAQYQAVLANLPYSLETKPQYDAFLKLLSEREAELKAIRSPFFQKADAARSEFTALEKAILAEGEPARAAERAWKEAELTRQREAEAKRNEEAMKVRNLAAFPIKVQELVLEYEASCKDRILKDPTLEIRMTQEAWMQICVSAQNQTGCAGYDASEVGATILSNKKAIWDEFDGAIQTFTNDVRTASNEELAAIKDTAEIEHQQAKEELQQEGQLAIIQAEVTNAEAAVPTGPTIRTKKVCVPSTNDEAGKVFALWLAEVKPDVAEVAKMISKAVTHATKRANDKTSWLELPGVTYREDVK